MSFVVLATITPLPEHRDAVRSALEAAVPAVHAEDGCNLYALHETRDSFVLIEQWRDRAALQTHAQGPALTTLTAALDGVLASPMAVQTLRPLPGGSPQQGVLRPQA
jgi:quinol monooxygenase YgiN